MSGLDNLELESQRLLLISDDEGGVMGEVDMWKKEQDKEMIETMRKGRRKKEEKGHKEVLALSGTDLTWSFQQLKS